METAPAAPAAQALAEGARVCIVGAGISGLTAAKALKDRGVPFDVFEQAAGVGGNWRIQNEASPAYRSLHINSSRSNMELADFPLPEDFPVFGHHSDVLDYFERYAEHFGLPAHIQFETKVTRVAPAPGEGHAAWDVTLQPKGGAEETRRYGAVVVCNGHHWNPRWPHFPGAFSGKEMHAHDYHDASAMAGEEVLVVGIGNSACDIAADLARPARSVTLSTRSGAHILPKYLLGIPLDQWTNRFYERWLPLGFRRALLRFLLFLSVGRQERYGMARPEHRLFEAHPTISQELLSHLGHGRVRIKPNVERLEGEGVVFEDGTHTSFDRVIYATGYDVAFPFLPDEVLAVEDNQVPLYRHVVPPAWPGLYFVGLLQPLGAVMPLSEIQSKWVAALLAGEAALPETAAMRASIQKTRARMARRYHRAARHTLQVDFHAYMMTIEREMKRGRKRHTSARS